MSHAEQFEHDDSLDAHRDAAAERFTAWARQEEEQRIADMDRLIEIITQIRQERPTWRFLLAGYNGYGDEGTTAYVGFAESEAVAEDANGWTPPDDLITEFPPGIDEGILEPLLDHFVPGGYQDNDGGQGVIRIDLASGQVEVHHEWNVSEVEDDLRTFDLAGSAVSVDEPPTEA